MPLLLKMPSSDFRKKVYELTKHIPPGKVATYGQLAKLAGHSGAARAVGQLMKNNPDPATIPCHRVVSWDGSLNGYSLGNGLSTKKQLLVDEGVTFVNQKVDLKQSLLRPARQ